MGNQRASSSKLPLPAIWRYWGKDLLQSGRRSLSINLRPILSALYTYLPLVCNLRSFIEFGAITRTLQKLKEQNSTLETGVKTSANVMEAKGLADFGSFYWESLTRKLLRITDECFDN